jgi:hypothetical protein
MRKKNGNWWWKNAFIGAIHRIAANMDGLIELHCGAFSSNPQTSIESGRFVSPGIKVYGSYHEMLVTESKLPLKKEWILCLLSRQFRPLRSCYNGFRIWV